MSARHPRPRRPALTIAGALLLAVLLLLAARPQTVFAQSPTEPAAWWRLDSTAAPTLLPREGQAQLFITASDVGDTGVDATSTPLTITDQLPAGVTPVAVEQRAFPGKVKGGTSCSTSERLITCIFKGGVLRPYEPLAELRITLTTANPTGAPSTNVLTVSGAGAPTETLEQQLAFQREPGEPTPFGIQAFQLTPEASGGAADTQAGSHPFQLTTLLDFNQTLQYYPPGQGNGYWPSAPALPRNLHFKLPAGLLGDPAAVPQCSTADFDTETTYGNLCPQDTAIGVATVTLFDPKDPGSELLTSYLPVFNLAPGAGEPARFGFVDNTGANVPVILKTALQTGGAYPVEVLVENAPQTVQLLASMVTIWGVPGDPVHAASRGWGCLEASTETPCEPQGEAAGDAFLTLPTSCAGAPRTTVSGESWAAPPYVGEQRFGPLEPVVAFPALTGCESLEFDPSFTTSLETPFASTPTGLAGTLTFPQAGLTAPEGRAESALSDTTLLLPEGVQVNPSAANGLTACTEQQAGYAGQNPETGIYEYTPAQPECPESSKVATVHARTPLLSEELTGSLYVMEPAPNGEAAKNPFDALVGLYVVLEAPRSGVLVKLGAEVHLDPSTGREEGVFPGTPQLPFHELTLSFFGGPRAATSSPAFCGSYQLTGVFTGFSLATSDVLSEPPFQITAGPGGSACPEGHLPFSPSLAAGPESPQAGALTPVVVKIGRPDGDQALTGISVTEPPGFAAVLASVTPCQEPVPGVEWSCGEASRIGSARVYSGLGSEPVSVTGQAYLTSGYDGAPFGLLIRTLAQAGPFNLGWVNVRSRIDVNPSTAQVTVTTDPGPRGEGVPTFLKGVPVQLKALEVAVDRPGFTFNPTNCTPAAFAGTLTGAEGASAPVSSAFTAEGCGALPFHPALEASTQGAASKVNGASLTVKVSSQGPGCREHRQGRSSAADPVALAPYDDPESVCRLGLRLHTGPGRGV